LTNIPASPTRTTAHQVVFHYRFQFLEPEKRNVCEDFALVGNRVIHDNIKGRHSITCHDQEPVINLINVPDLSPFYKLKTFKITFSQDT
jgi:hypothetical protein